MEGLQILKNVLRSKVNILSGDLDSQFAVPSRNYGLVLFLGLLYHLKNPFYALEKLSFQARYCLLSTRIARYASDRKRLLEDLPVAYLVGPRETNNDPTNFWIFSRMGLERLFCRTGWEICHYLSSGNQKNSDPASPEGDERAFVCSAAGAAPDAASAEARV